MICVGWCMMSLKQLEINLSFNKDEKMAGKKWYYALMRRHLELSPCEPEDTPFAWARGFKTTRGGLLSNTGRDMKDHFVNMAQKYGKNPVGMHCREQSENNSTNNENQKKTHSHESDSAVACPTVFGLHEICVRYRVSSITINKHHSTLFRKSHLLLSLFPLNITVT